MTNYHALELDQKLGKRVELVAATKHPGEDVAAKQRRGGPSSGKSGSSRRPAEEEHETLNFPTALVCCTVEERTIQHPTVCHLDTVGCAWTTKRPSAIWRTQEMSRVLHGSGHFSWVGSGHGKPSRPEIMENLPTRPDPTRPVRLRTPPDPTRPTREILKTS